MLRHPAVLDCAVVAGDDQEGRKRLIAHVVPRTAGQAPSGQEMRAFLAERLPEQMVPTRYYQAASIPLAPSGKRDRTALLRPSAGSLETKAPYCAPRSYEEETLAAVWANVFNLDHVGIDDNYFALGGDSLRSVQVSALAQKRGLTVSVATIHSHPTIRQLAAALRGGDPLAGAAPVTAPFSLISDADRALMPEGVEDAYPLNLLQEGMIYHREFSPKSAVYHAICSYRIRTRFKLGVMRAVISALVTRHPLLRTSFDLSHFSRPLQLVHRSFHDPLEYLDLRGKPENWDAVADAWMEREKSRGFDLDEYPLIRFSIHQFKEDEFQLTYSFHHEIIDGWSDAFMVTELLTHYFCVMHGKPFALPPQTTSFRDAIRLEQLALEHKPFHQFWMQHLDGAQLMRLPRQISRPKADKGEREIVKFEVPVTGELSESIKQLARSLAVPVKTVLLAAHLRVMSVFGGGSDVTSYTVSNGRPENTEGHRVIGLFVNSLAFRLPMPGGTWTDLILSTLAREHELLPYRRYPMAELKRQNGNEPLSETLFFFNHYHVADVLNQWEDAELLGIKVYGESTFPFCINAYLAPVTKRLGMRIEYDRLQYAAELMESMQDCYVETLRAMTADVAGPLRRGAGFAARAPGASRCRPCVGRCRSRGPDAPPVRAGRGGRAGPYRRRLRRQPDQLWSIARPREPAGTSVTRWRRAEWRPGLPAA